MVDYMICLGGDNMDYESIFRKKQHYVTIPQIPSRKLFVNNRLLNRLVAKQEPDWDIYITKYPKDHCVSCIILDFDDKDNPENAFKDGRKLKKFLHRKGLNTVIVQSGRKGVHCYIQVPCHNFVGGELAHADAEPNTWFKQYIKNLIGIYDDRCYSTLDDINFSAGLSGNIRLIGSTHPRGTVCEIVDGEFLPDVEPNAWDWQCFSDAKSYAEDDVTEFAEVTEVNIEGIDLINDNDLREVIPEVFGLNPKRYSKGYMYGKCPFHNDDHESFFFDKEKYRCNACGERGNIWTLIKKGYVKLDNDLRIKK